jgi:CRP/FNR family cyclic AMP-dependent transcriptional regulator
MVYVERGMTMTCRPATGKATSRVAQVCNIITSPGGRFSVFRARIPNGITFLGRKEKETVFLQGDPSDAIFYIQEGKVRLTVTSNRGKEAIVGVLGAREFAGDQCLADEMFRTMTATAVENCSLVRVERGTMLRILREDPGLSITLIFSLLSQNRSLHDDLVDHFFNHSEKRLARLLLSLAHYGKDSKTHGITPKINQETLAEMVGTTRGRISLFMNKFRKQGLIDYKNDCNRAVRVHSSLLNVILRD